MPKTIQNKQKILTKCETQPEESFKIVTPTKMDLFAFVMVHVWPAKKSMTPAVTPATRKKCIPSCVKDSWIGRHDFAATFLARLPNLDYKQFSIEHGDNRILQYSMAVHRRMISLKFARKVAYFDHLLRNRQNMRAFSICVCLLDKMCFEINLCSASTFL